MGLGDWFGNQINRAGYQLSRGANAAEGMWGGGVQNYDPSNLDAFGDRRAPGTSAGGDFGNTLTRTGMYAGSGAAIGSVLGPLGTTVGGALGGGLGLAQSLFGGGDDAVANDKAIAAQQQPTPAAQNVPIPTSGSSPVNIPQGGALKAAYQGATYGPNAQGLDANLTPAQMASSAVDNSAANWNALRDRVGQQGFGGIDTNSPAYQAAMAHAQATPYAEANGQANGALAAQNGGGALGGYGNQYQNTAMASANNAATNNASALGMDALKYNANAQQTQGQMLSTINSANRTPDQYAAISNEADQQGQRQFGNTLATNEFNAGQANIANNQAGQGLAGIIGAAGTPIGQKIAGAAYDEAGNLIGAGVNAAKGYFNPTATGTTMPTNTPPPGTGVQSDPSQSASANPIYGLSSLGGTQPKGRGVVQNYRGA